VQELRGAVLEADGLSFAQLRESYIIAGKLAFDSERPVSVEHLHGKESTLFVLRVPE
jgi:hypothetical protein